MTAGDDVRKLVAALREQRQRALMRSDAGSDDSAELERQTQEAQTRGRGAWRTALEREPHVVIQATELHVEPLPPLRVEIVSSREKTRPGPKSKWRPTELESITKQIANGESFRTIERKTGIRHQRISELHRRGVYWDVDRRRVVTPPGTVRDGGYVILPPAP